MLRLELSNLHDKELFHIQNLTCAKISTVYVNLLNSVKQELFQYSIKLQLFEDQIIFK